MLLPILTSAPLGPQILHRQAIDGGGARADEEASVLTIAVGRELIDPKTLMTASVPAMQAANWSVFPASHAWAAGRPAHSTAAASAEVLAMREALRLRLPRARAFSGAAIPGAQRGVPKAAMRSVQGELSGRSGIHARSAHVAGNAA